MASALPVPHSLHFPRVIAQQYSYATFVQSLFQPRMGENVFFFKKVFILIVALLGGWGGSVV
jgi:hypothetical protein